MTESPTSGAGRAVLAAHARARFVRLSLLALGLALVILLVLYGATVGAANLSLGEVWAAVAGRFFPERYVVSDMARRVVWDIRLPRLAMSVLSGFGLGISGFAMQGVLRNPLASPFTLGLSTAAAFGAALAIVLGVGVLGGQYLIIGNAFLFSLLCALVVLGLSTRRKASPESVILAGIAIMYLFSAGITVLEFVADPYALQAVVFWIIGDVGRSNWQKLLVLAAILAVCVPVLVRLAWDINIMESGDETAASLGLKVGSTRLAIMAASALITAAIVSFIGAIGFIGLVAPHIARLALGPDARIGLPAAGLVGALLLTAADIVSLRIIAPNMLPIGVVTALMGVPLFLSLILRRRRAV